MAFAERTLRDLDRHTENRELSDECGAQLNLTLADAKKLASATPLVPMDFEAFLSLLFFPVAPQSFFQVSPGSVRTGLRPALED